MASSSKTIDTLSAAPLGKASAYVSSYTPSLLFALPRSLKRGEIGILGELPFAGVDIWNGYELSWLNPKGKPVVAMAEFRIPARSPNLIESKSFKLYLNSLNNSTFASMEEVEVLIAADLSNCTGAAVGVQVLPLDAPQLGSFAATLRGRCLDDLDISCSSYQPDPRLLGYPASQEIVEEALHTHLLKSNCLITGQPDWGSLEVCYRGPQLDAAGLLRYIVSLRDHHEFHEQCVERIFVEIERAYSPQWLSVYARYTRRGGLDINPYRASTDAPAVPGNTRLVRQ